MPPYYGPTNWDYELNKWIDRSKSGLLLLLIGLIVGVIPLVGIFGFILALIGTIFLILGRRAFGDKHSKYVLLSVGAYIFGYVVVGFALLSFILTLTSAAASGTVTDRATVVTIVSSATNTLLIGLIVGGLITAFAYVLVTYAIQSKVGRILLWSAYGISLAIGVAIYVIFSPQIPSVINASIVSGTFSSGPLNDFQARISSFRLLNVISFGLYALSYYLVWSRINRGELPASTLPQPPIPPTMPPTM